MHGSCWWTIYARELGLKGVYEPGGGERRQF